METARGEKNEKKIFHLSRPITIHTILQLSLILYALFIIVNYHHIKLDIFAEAVEHCKNYVSQWILSD
jgi:hypothetical protein